MPAIFAALGVLARQSLQLLAILDEPAPATLVGQCLHRAGLRDENGQPLGTVRLLALLSELRQQEMLTPDNRCPDEYIEPLTRRALQEGTFPALADAVQREASLQGAAKWPLRAYRLRRLLRLGIYCQDFELLEEAQQQIAQQLERFRQIFGPVPLCVQLLLTPFDPVWLGNLNISFQFYLINQALYSCLGQARVEDEFFQYLHEMDKLGFSAGEMAPFQRLRANLLLFQGQHEALGELLEQHDDSFHASGHAAALRLLRGEKDEARDLFRQDLEQLRQDLGEEQPEIYGFPGLLHNFMELGRAGAVHHGRLPSVRTEPLEDSSEPDFALPLQVLIRGQGADPAEIVRLAAMLDSEQNLLEMLPAALVLYWLGLPLDERRGEILQRAASRALAAGLQWLAMEFFSLAGRLTPEGGQAADEAARLQRELGCASIVDLLQPADSWRRGIESLLQLANVTSEQSPCRRIVWRLTCTNGQVVAQAREQQRGVEGKWNKGRSVSTTRLFDTMPLEELSPRDRDIVEGVRRHGQRNLPLILPDAVLPSLIGHPRLELSHANATPLEFLAGEPELLLEEQGEELVLRFMHDFGERELLLVQESLTRYKLVRIDEEHRRLARILGKDGLKVPQTAQDQLISALGSLASRMTIHSAVPIEIYRDIPPAVVEADPTIHVLMAPLGQGFRLEMYVKPFGAAGPYLKPGQGLANVVALVEGRRQQTRRNLPVEENRAREVEESCPMLDLAMDFEQDTERAWSLHDPEECLQLLLELQEIKDRIAIEWPEGERLSVRRHVGVGQLNLRITTDRQDWFLLNGSLQLDQDHVIELKTLLDQVRKRPGRFISLGEGQFMALTQELRRRLDDILALAEEGRDENAPLRLHPLTALALTELTERSRIEADQPWHDMVQRIAECRAYSPDLPTTLQADLRDYQREGFLWMARLARLGLGGCLADDMGLGKTLQALALILQLAQDGPSLVVAPTSVCMNWVLEAQRFAPTLQVQSLSGVDRENLVRGLGRFDLLVTSYTLLQQESKLLGSIDWQAIVLDEAQAIKNASTKRSRAAMGLRGHCRFLTTGTPLENHLGELWNLFRFINPGLLGTLKRFNERFAIPVEKHQDREARRRLKKLIRPFILRRIKSQVLDELPPRTETTIWVELRQEELQLYEALRQQALEKIDAGRETSGRQLQILTEIMHLRRACCNPRLILPDSNITSSKLEAFAELVDDLLGARHKALVFSQFTGHLALILEYLNGRGISYQYLDGSTPARERQRRVEAFQAGEGDLFLISLKAGGVGLNLTAADYVIHMDPWWNPAVEDQASDRAHRIGQERPVTIYRLVSLHTIEEKIVRLHQRKRALAYSLLEGTDSLSHIDPEELLALIRED
ncbi:MAG: hypothetical protein BWK76_05670 [Desulfobulbaceae bacterium A2]|nr:MAG: hypothetical protein BWK76_05670 [Desulfobulbaceae bacterium A2]